MNSHNGTRKKVLSNLIWRFAERCGAQGVGFIVSIVLARILMPDDYGVIALITIFTNIMNVFVDSGMGNALIQKKDADDIDFSSVFYFNIFWCIILYLVLFFASPAISVFYQKPELTPVTRVLGITILISGVKNVQQAYVSKTLQFKRFFFSTLGGTIGAAIVGIVMAYQGFGVWALVAQQIFNISIDTIILWITVKWRPKKVFSWERLKGLFSYGWKLLASALLDVGYNNLRQLIIGKVYSTEDLAYYTKGDQFPNLVVTNINSSIDSVLLPVISTEQENKEQVKLLTRRAISTSSYIIWPLVIGLAACAEPFVRLILTEKWLFCVPYLRVFCLIYGFWPVHTANLNAIKAVGRSDIFLKLEIIKKTIGLLSIIISIRYGVFAIAMASLIVAPLSVIINATPNVKLLGYSYHEQLKDMCPSMLLSVVMGILVYGISYLPIHDFYLLLFQILGGIILYLLISFVLKIEAFVYLLEMYKNAKGKIKKG